jgi:hypothetical protein
LIVTKHKVGLRVDVYEQTYGSPKRRLCCVSFFEANAQSGGCHIYYYELPNKPEEQAGAGPTTTKPADKTPLKNQSSTPTSKNSSR